MTTLLEEIKYRRYRDDPRAFFREVWFIQHPERGAILFDLFPAQDDALTVFMDERMIITLKSRQIGWTTLVAGYAFWLTFFHPDRLVIFLSKGEREAAVILKMAKYGLKRLPAWLLRRGPSKLTDNMSVMEFDNGSSIESLPSKKDPARGRSAYLVVVDEWAFLEDPDEAWASIEPIADVGGRIIGLSTANGSGNFFHTTWLEAELGHNDFKTLFEPWNARGDRNQDWYDTKKRTLPPWQLAQEYPSTPEEAFIKSGNPYFDTDKLQRIETKEPRCGWLERGDFVTFMEGPGGKLRIFELPEALDTYVVGADVAEGLAHGDYSVAHVIRWRTRDVVAVWHGHLAPEKFAEVCADLGRFYNTALVGVESNNHGLTTCKYLKDWYNYPNIFYARIVDERTKKVTNKIGWATTKRTRPLMLDALSSGITEETLGIPDAPTIAELRTFVRDEYGRLRGSPFDDRTMSLAVAVQMLDYVTQPMRDRGGQVPWGSMLFWKQEADKQRLLHTTAGPIGSHNVRG